MLDADNGAGYSLLAPTISQMCDGLQNKTLFTGPRGMALLAMLRFAPVSPDTRAQMMRAIVDKLVSELTANKQRGAPLDAVAMPAYELPCIVHISCSPGSAVAPGEATGVARIPLAASVFVGQTTIGELRAMCVGVFPDAQVELNINNVDCKVEDDHKLLSTLTKGWRGRDTVVVKRKAADGTALAPTDVDEDNAKIEAAVKAAFIRIEQIYITTTKKFVRY